MTEPEPAAMFPVFSLNLRRPLILSVLLGVLAVVVAGLLHHILMGILVFVGLALGLLNVWLVQRAVTRITAQDNPSKQRMAYSSATRLLLITGVALVLGFLLRPDGLGIFAGLALFQVITVLNTTVPVLKGLRQQS